MLGNQPRRCDERRHCDAWVQGHEARAEQRTRRSTLVVDARRVEVARRITVHVHADLDDAHELHQIDYGLAV